MSESANDRASLGVFFLLLFTGTLVVVTESVTVTSPIANITRDVDYYWYRPSSNNRQPCYEIDVSNNNCTYQLKDPSEELACLGVLNGKGLTVALFTLNETTLQARDCRCTYVFYNVSNNVTRVENSTGCPCDGSYLNQLLDAVCNASGIINQSPSPYYYRNDTNVTFTCLIDSVKNDQKVSYLWTFYNSSSFQQHLNCQEPITSTNCTVPGQEQFAGAIVQCLAITKVTAAPCISTPVKIGNSTRIIITSTTTSTSTNTTSGATPLGNDLGLYLHTLLAWFVVSTNWFYITLGRQQSAIVLPTD